MEKNTILAIVLSTLVLVASAIIQMNLYPAKNIQAPPVANETISVAEETNNIIAENDENTEISEENILTNDEPLLEEKNYTIVTEKAKIIFTNRGGDIISYELLEHQDGETNVQMAENIQETNRAFSVAFGKADSPIINDIFNVKQIDDYTIGFYKTYKKKNSFGQDTEFVFAKQYSFKPDDYMFRLDISVDGDNNFEGLNFEDVSYTLRTSPQIGPHYDPKNDRYEYRKFVAYTKDKKKNTMVNPGQIKAYNKEFTWTGIAGKYFEILGIPKNMSSIKNALYSCAVGYENELDAQVMLSRNSIVGKESKDTYYFYVGPRTEKQLKIYNNPVDNSWEMSGLKLNDSLESTGILSWLETFLKWCMELFYKVIPNWGVSIIILTIFIKILLFPLTKKSSMSSLKMQEVQPRMKEIQDKYKDQPEKMNQEMAKLYQETGFNPLSGCLPLLIQFPLIFAMYNLFNNYFEFRGAMFIPGWIPDLSVGDSIYTFGFSLPFGLGNQIRLLPIIYVVSQIIFSKITQAGSTGANGTQMKFMMYGMPLIFFFIFYNAPSGLLIYWTVSNLLQLVQQVLLNRVIKAKKAEIERNKDQEKKVFIPRKKK